MSVVVTVQSGFDLEYYLAQAGQEPEHSPGGYYINASIRGEAPGRWFGAGAEASGCRATSTRTRSGRCTASLTRGPASGWAARADSSPGATRPG